MNEINLDVKRKLWPPEGKRYFISWGGIRSGKTFTLYLWLIKYCRKYSGKRILVLRKTLKDVKHPWLSEFIQVLRALGQWRFAEHNKAEKTIRLYGNTIRYAGTADPDSFTGGSVDVVWMNEANQIPKRALNELKGRTTERFIFDLNPEWKHNNHWLDELMRDERCAVTHSTYKDNLDNLTEDQIKDIESYTGNEWLIKGLGKKGHVMGAYFEEWQAVPDDFDWQTVGDVSYGLDFGWASPSALVKVGFKEDRLYVQELAYDTELRNSDFDRIFTEHAVGNAPIYCDHEADRIDALYRKGWNVQKAKKDVQAGIASIKEHKLHADGVNLQREISEYRRQKDRQGNYIDRPVKENDHSVDAMRYAVHSHAHREEDTQDMMTITF